MVEQGCEIFVILRFGEVTFHANQNGSCVPDAVAVNVIGVISIVIAVFKGIHVVCIFE